MSEFGANVQFHSDWRPPKIYSYNLATKKLTAQASVPGLTSTLGIRSAGSLNGVVFLAGPSLQGSGIYLFAYSSNGAFLGSTELTGSLAVQAPAQPPDVNQRATPNVRDRWTYVILAVFIAVLWFATSSMRPLFNTDEGRYAEIPREMLSGGDWVIPHLNGLAYIEKPPLQYWATAFCLRAFGQSEFAARFYTVLCALATVLAMCFVAKRLWGRAAAWRTAAMLPSMLLFLAMGQLLTLDMSLTLYMSLALAGFLLSQTAGAVQHATYERRWMLIAWAAAGLGVLTKGLVAAAIPAAVLVLYSLYARNFAVWRRLHLSSGLPLFLVITVPWHWLAARRLPDFLQFFFVHEHLARYLTPSADREESWWFFGAVFLIGSAPWTLSALRVMFRGWQRGAARDKFNPVLFLRIWVLFVCVFFSLSNSKLIPYILPAMPALALLMASLPEEVLKREILRTALLTLCAAIALALVCLFGPRLIAPSDRNGYFVSLAKPLAQIAALLAASGLYVLSQRRRDSPVRRCSWAWAGVFRAYCW